MAERTIALFLHYGPTLHLSPNPGWPVTFQFVFQATTFAFNSLCVVYGFAPPACTGLSIFVSFCFYFSTPSAFIFVVFIHLPASGEKKYFLIYVLTGKIFVLHVSMHTKQHRENFRECLGTNGFSDTSSV